MGLGIQAYIAVLLWNNLLACEPCLQDYNGKRKPIEYTIINLNGKQMEVLWDARKNLPDINVTMFYTNANGSEEFYYDEQKSKRFFKPLPPENITFQWENDTMTAEYSPPKFPSSKLLDFELQYKSNFDSKWQERKSPCCKITVPGFDSEKCYVFRFRLKMSKVCTPACYPSEWGAEMHWKNGCLVGKK
ncbi:hypothetical protein lerEdw1_016629 [Lerista edwardsae]|nr:hypothetical protein lerEdw1_016629 [Lerista edwardsae]